MTLVSYVPKQSNAVVLISSMHNTIEVDPTSRKPEIILFYNKTKAGVDNLDAKCSKLCSGRKTCRWPMAVFLRIVDICSANSHVLFLS